MSQQASSLARAQNEAVPNPEGVMVSSTESSITWNQEAESHARQLQQWENGREKWQQLSATYDFRKLVL